MQTVILDVEDDKLETFMTIIKNLSSDIVKNIKIQKELFFIEPIEEDSEDFKVIEEIKKQNNKKYTIDEAKEILSV